MVVSVKWYSGGFGKVVLGGGGGTYSLTIQAVVKYKSENLFLRVTSSVTSCQREGLARSHQLLTKAWITRIDFVAATSILAKKSLLVTRYMLRMSQLAATKCN